MEMVGGDKNGEGGAPAVAAVYEPMSNEDDSSPPPLPPPGYVEEMPGEFSEEVSVTPPSNDSECTDDDEGREDGDVEVRGLIHSVVQNEAILEHLFGLCHPNLLVNFRLVSKLWQKESHPFLRASVQVRFDMPHGYGKFQRFLEFLENPDNGCDSKPYRWIRLENWNFREERETIDAALWRVCAISITKLELWHCTFDRMEGLPKVVFSSFPNLHTFVMARCTMSDEDEERDDEEDAEDEEEEEEVEDHADQQENDDEELDYWHYPTLKFLSIDQDFQPLPVPWLVLFSHFPYLTSLKVESAGHDGAIEEMLVAMTFIRERDNRHLQLIHLDLLRAFPSHHWVVSMEVCNLLRELQLPLKSLSIDSGVKTEPGVIKDILDVHAETLECLTALRNEDEQFPCGGVQLDSLEELTISEKFPEYLNFRKIVHKSSLNLKTLVVGGYGMNPVQEPIEENESSFHWEYPNVLSLTVDLGWNWKPPLASWLELFSTFSNLTSLKVKSPKGHRKGVASDVIVEMLKAVQIIRREDEQKLALKHLDILHVCRDGQKVIPPNLLPILQELQLPLETFALDLGQETELSVVQDILQVHANTLESFSTFRCKYNSQAKELEYYLEELENLNRVRISELYLKDLAFRKTICSCCPSLQELEVDRYDLTIESENVGQVDAFFTPYTKLKSLTINLDWKPLPVPVSWVDLLSIFPNLTSLKLEHVDEEDGGGVIAEMVTAIQTIRKEDSCKLPLKHLNVLHILFNPQTVCVALRELQPPLESLAIDFGKGTEPAVLKNILADLKGLKSLTAYRDPESSPYETFPFGVHLDNLLELAISESVCADLNFLNFTLNLVKLQIGDFVSDEPSTVVGNTRFLAYLTEFGPFHLSELVLNQKVSTDQITLLAGWMPTVEKLSMTLDDQRFRVVCKAWRKLQHLKVFGYELTDDGVTGRKYRERNGHRKATQQTDLFGLRPNITWLSDLTSFSMGYGNDKGSDVDDVIDDYDNDSESLHPTQWRDELFPNLLTDASAFHGFLHLNRLQSLKLRCQMSHDAKTALRQKISHCRLIDSKVRGDDCESDSEWDGWTGETWESYLDIDY